MTKRGSRVRPFLIAITGGSASGKSWLAHRLAVELGPNTTILEMDRFYRDRSHLPAQRADRLNFDHPLAIEWPLLHRTLRRLLRGRRVYVPRYDYLTHGRRRDPHPLTCGRWLILEGLWALRSPRVRSQLSFGIFVECDDTVRLARRLERDARDRGLPRKLVIQQYRRQVQPMHRRYVQPQRNHAELIVRSPIRRADLDRIVRQLNRAEMTQSE